MRRLLIGLVLLTGLSSLSNAATAVEVLENSAKKALSIIEDNTESNEKRCISGAFLIGLYSGIFFSESSTEAEKNGAALILSSVSFTYHKLLTCPEI